MKNEEVEDATFSFFIFNFSFPLYFLSSLKFIIFPEKHFMISVIKLFVLIELMFLFASCHHDPNSKIEKTVLDSKAVKLDSFYLDPNDTMAGKEYHKK